MVESSAAPLTNGKDSNHVNNTPYSSAVYRSRKKRIGSEKVSENAVPSTFT